MKALLTCFVGLALALAVFAGEVDLSKPVSIFRLSDGRVLKNVTFAKFNADTVLVRSNLGSLALRYEALPDDIRAAAEQKRPGGARWFPGDTSGNSETIEGQVFIQTQGASSYKFGNIDVYAFDLAALSYLDNPQGTVRLPKPIHRVTTDADGKFTIRVPLDRPYFIFAQATRVITGGTEVQEIGYEWRVPMNAVRRGKLLALSTEHRFARSKVVIEAVD